ncbi:MAG: MBL fold metallo-hydrolase [Promethearchaeota archaeon]
MNKWFEIQEIKKYIYVIKERLDLIDPRFLTEFTNIFLVLGSTKALLMDTGSGLYPIKPVVDKIIGDRELIVVNTHSHFDHIGGNEEFEEVYIHEKEANNISKQFNAFFLKNSPMKIVELYEERNFKFKPTKSVISIQDGKIFDLGGIKLEVMHTPGHSSGSICLLTDKGELFTGDAAHYGTLFLPTPKEMPIFINSITKLLEIVKNSPNIEIYPSHEQFPVGTKKKKKMISGFKNLKNLNSTRITDREFGMWIYKGDNFDYSAPITPLIRRLAVFISGKIFKFK